MLKKLSFLFGFLILNHTAHATDPSFTLFVKCKGINQYGDQVEASLFTSRKKGDLSPAILKVIVENDVGSQTDFFPGYIYNKPDLINTYQYFDNFKTCRFLTSGLLYCTDSYYRRSNAMKCEFSKTKP